MKPIYNLIYASVTLAVGLATDLATVHQMGDPTSSASRQRAMASLIARGPDARLAARLAMRDDDPEIRFRGQIVWNAIQPRVKALFVSGFSPRSGEVAIYLADDVQDQYRGVDCSVVFAGIIYADGGELIVMTDGKVTFQRDVWQKYKSNPQDPEILRALRGN